jgi:hypothetical protein
MPKPLGSKQTPVLFTCLHEWREIAKDAATRTQQCRHCPRLRITNLATKKVAFKNLGEP